MKADDLHRAAFGASATHVVVENDHEKKAKWTAQSDAGAVEILLARDLYRVTVRTHGDTHGAWATNTSRSVACASVLAQFFARVEA